MGFLFPLLGEDQKRQIRALENNALRIILHKKRQECTPTELHEIANLDMLDDRLSTLTNKYFENTINNNNPVINDLIEECKNYHNEMLINPNVADNDLSLTQLIIENNIIKGLQKLKPTSILSSVNTFENLLWDTNYLTQNDSTTESYGVMYSSYNAK